MKITLHGETPRERKQAEVGDFIVMRSGDSYPIENLRRIIRVETVADNAVYHAEVVHKGSTVLTCSYDSVEELVEYYKMSHPGTLLIKSDDVSLEVPKDVGERL